jgi:L-asparaginase
MRRPCRNAGVRRLVSACLVVALLRATAAFAQPVPGDSTVPALPRVRLVATGGTISVSPDGRLTAGDLAAAVPALETIVSIEPEQFANVASSALTLAQWLELSRLLNTRLRDDEALAGVVVTAGTDTLEELAFFLHLTVRDPRPVVVTGAMRNAGQVGYDGPANLRAAMRVAAAPDAADRGVLVVLNDEIHSARDVTKSDALRLHTFVARNAGPLGTVEDDRVVLRRRIDARHTSRSEFNVFAIEQLPRVDVVMTYQDADGDLFRRALEAADGVVTAGAGTGALSTQQSDVLREPGDVRKPVVSTTRTGRGRVAPISPEVRRARQGPHWPIGGEDHTPIKARVLLMLALGVTSDPDEIQRIFTEY